MPAVGGASSDGACVPSRLCAELRVDAPTLQAAASRRAAPAAPGQAQQVHLGMVWAQGAALAHEVLQPAQRDADWLAACAVSYSQLPLPSAELLAEIPDGSLGGGGAESRCFQMLRGELGQLLERLARWLPSQSADTEVACARQVDALGLCHLARVLCATAGLELHPETRRRCIRRLVERWQQVELPPALRAAAPCFVPVRQLLGRLQKSPAPAALAGELQALLPACERACACLPDGR